MTLLEQHYLDIKKLFFPRWDPEGLWRVSGSLGTGSGHICPDGHCCMKERVLHVLTGHADHERMLVHLICHAVTENSHESHWRDRMLKAMMRAKQLQRRQLSEALRSEVEHYLYALKPTMESVEKKSFEIAIDLPESTPDVWLEVVSSHYGLTGIELKRKFPAAPGRGFRKAERWIRSKNERQLSFL